MHRRGNRGNNRGIEQPPIKPTSTTPTRRRKYEIEAEEELKEKKREISESYTNSDARIEGGIVVIKQKEFPNRIEMYKGSGREITIINGEKSVEAFGPNMHFRMEETDTGGRRVTFAVFNDSQGLYEKTIEIGADNPTAKLGNLELKHNKDDNSLEIVAKTEHIKGANLGEEETITFRGFDQDREVKHKDMDKDAFIYREMNINSVNNSKKVTSNENKEFIIEIELKKFGELYGATRIIIRMIPVIVTDGIPQSDAPPRYSEKDAPPRYSEKDAPSPLEAGG